MGEISTAGKGWALHGYQNVCIAVHRCQKKSKAASHSLAAIFQYLANSAEEDVEDKMQHNTNKYSMCALDFLCNVDIYNALSRSHSIS